MDPGLRCSVYANWETGSIVEIAVFAMEWECMCKFHPLM
jgi:hypothetical protein